jgi:hypothetical protein
MRVVFLLGAGVSRTVLPLTGSLAEIVLNGQTSEVPPRFVQRHSDRTYFLDGEIVGDRKSVERVVGYLNWLRDLVCAEDPDYEALYFACQQVYDAHTGNLENPILESFLRSHERVVRRFTTHSRRYPALSVEITAEAMSYIAWVVAESLIPRHPESGLRAMLRSEHRAVLNAACDPDVNALDVVTLNHDTLLETTLRDAGVRFEDGFRSRTSAPKPMSSVDSVRLWRGFRFKKRRRVRLIKLHGSTDWWRIRPQDADWRGEEFVSSPTMPTRMTSPDGRLWDDPLDARPLILVGTFNKILEYARPFPLDRYVVFRRALKRADRVIVSGYSFRDQAVNGLLIDWFRSEGTNRKLVVVGPGLESGEPPRTARQAVARKWRILVDEGRIMPIGALFGEMEWHVLKTRMPAAPRNP